MVAACCFVLCLPLSSAYAVLDDYDINDGEIHVNQLVGYVRDRATNTYEYFADTDWLNVTVTGLKWTSNPFTYNAYKTDDFRLTFQIRNGAGEALFAQNETAVLNFSGVVHSVVTGSGEVAYLNPDGIESIEVIGYNTNGSAGTVLPDATVTISRNFDNTFSINLNSGVLDFPCSRFQINFYYSFEDAFALSYSDFLNGTTTHQLNYGFDNFVFDYSYFPASSSITSKIQETTTEIKEELVELPNKMWGVFEDGLTSLIVPDEDAMTSQQDKWNQLLADRFGALYQVGDLVTDYAAAFVESEQDTIDIPTVEIPLGEVDFTFGGWTVQVVPDGFQVVIDALKLIVSIACTFLFVNGLKRRFEGLLGGAPSA